MVMDRTTQVHRGDVIVEQQPSTGPVYFIRRVIGLPGDHVACCHARGRITVNGKPLTRPTATRRRPITDPVQHHRAHGQALASRRSPQHSPSIPEPEARWPSKSPAGSF